MLTAGTWTSAFFSGRESSTDDIDQGLASDFIFVSRGARVESDKECCVLSTGCEGKLVSSCINWLGSVVKACQKN